MNTIEVKISIEKRVKEDVFVLFSQGKFEEGARILQGLSFRLQADDDTELQRLVLRNLSFAFYKINDRHMSRKYAKMIKKIADKDKDFQEKNKESYGDILNLHSEFCPDEISLQDKINISKLNRKIYHNNENFMYRYYMAEANICILTKRYEDIEDIIWQIHNKVNSEIFEDIEKDKMMKANLEDTKLIILQDLEIASPIIYKRLIKDINSLQQSNSIIAI